MTDPTDGGTVRYHRADWVPERDRWVVTFPGGRVQGFTAEQGEAMGLTSPEPEAAPLVVTCNGHSMELSDEEAGYFIERWAHEDPAELTVPFNIASAKLARLLRDARQDPQPASDAVPEPDASDTLDFDAMPIGTVAEVTLLDGDRLLALKDGDGPDYKWYVGDSSVVDITRLRDVRVVYRPAPVSPYEGLRAVLAGRDDADELMQWAAEAWGGQGLTPDGRWRAAVGAAARSGGAT